MPLPIAYGTVTDVYNNQPGIETVSNITSATVAFFLGKAEALINGKIIRSYSLPISPTPPLLQTLAADIATYYIVAQRLFTAKTLEDSPWPLTFKEAIETLNEVAKGETPLVSSAGAIISKRTDVEEVWSNTQDYEPTFSELPEETEQFIDPDKVDDLRGDRGLS